MPAAVLVLFAMGCGANEKPAGAAAQAGDSASAGADTIALSKKADSSKADSTRRARAGGRRDSAFGPKLEVDSTGKVKKIKKP